MKIRLNSNILGWNAFSTFIFSNTLIIMTLGVSLLVAFIKVILMAKYYVTEADNSDFSFILILGMQLDNNQINDNFLLRLERGLTLFNHYQQQHTLIVLGGLTQQNTLTEAEAGAAYLMANKIDKKQIVLENKSQNTLENLKNARTIIATSAALIVSNRYHLYRIHCLAKTLKLKTIPIAAEEQFTFSGKILLDCLKEAYFVHWYFSGKLWIMITRDKLSHAQIS